MAGVAWHGTPEQWQGVAEHIMAAGAWRPAFRRVCRQWRNVFDTRVPLDALPKSYCIDSVEELERAVAERAYERCRLCVGLDDFDMTELSSLLLDLVVHVHALSLEGCHGVTNVSALGSVHALYLYGCTGIRDVSALGGVARLMLPSGETR